jgi:hypothetical protein
MKRQEFIALLGSTALSLQCGATAQQPASPVRPPQRFGVSPSPAATFNPVDEAFEKSLEQLGWIRDRTIKIDYRYTDGRLDKVSDDFCKRCLLR